MTENNSAAVAAYHAAVAEGYAPIGAHICKGTRSAVQIVAERLRIYRATALKRILAGTTTPPAAPAEPAPHPGALAIQRANDKANRTGAELQAALRREASLTDQLEAMQSLGRAKVGRLNWAHSAPAVAKKQTLVPILFTSDFQVGEVIGSDAIDGLNSYDSHIFGERYRRMIDRTIETADHHVGAAHFPGCFYLRGGDAISGSIHADLAETNDLAAVPAIRLCVEHEAEGIRQLAARFGKVQVVSLRGNHGRDTLKPRSKNEHARNLETMLAWWLESIFAGDDRVTFYTPLSADARFSILGHSFLMSHGDRMGSKGGTGFIGPAATIARGHQRIYQNWTRTGVPVDLVLTGHLHTSVKLELGFGNGSLAGYSEYARDLRCIPAPASQWLIFASESRPAAQQFELQLSDLPRRSVRGFSIAA